MKKMRIAILVLGLIFAVVSIGKADMWSMLWPDIYSKMAQPVVSYGFNTQQTRLMFGVAGYHLNGLYVAPPVDQSFYVCLTNLGMPANITSGGFIIWPMYTIFSYEDVSPQCYKITGVYSPDGITWYELEPKTVCVQ